MGNSMGNLNTMSTYASDAKVKQTGLNETFSKISGKKHASPEEIQKSAEDFEAVFLSEMLGQVFSQLPTNAIFGGGPGEDTWKSMLVQEYSKIIVKTGGIGVADQVKKEMLKLQESSNA